MFGYLPKENIMSITSPGDFLPRNPRPSTASAKMFWLIQVLRLLSVGYVAWVLARVVSWWTDPGQVIQHMGQYLRRDLSELSTASRMTAMTLDLAVWLLLLAAVVCGWRSLGLLLQEQSFTRPMARLLTWAGWLGALGQGLTLLFRPLQTYLMTAHLPPSELLFKWALYPQDLLSALLCGVLLCFAYMITWAVDLAEENRGFV